ncbi:MAG: PAS domain-containing protein [Planctomycetes bacterium]|nr:PAS domain-containing protein [Planctomycetota bacterium]
MIEAQEQDGRKTRRIERYLIFRLAIILMAFSLVAFHQLEVEPGQKEPAFRFLYSLLVTYTAVALVSLALAPRGGSRRWFVSAQVGIDFGAGILLTGATGGVVSVFVPVLFVTLVSACTILPLKGAIAFATLATVFLAMTELCYNLSYLPAPAIRARWFLNPPQMQFLSSYLVAIGFTLHIVAVLGSRLSTGLLRIQNLQAEIFENMGEGLVAIDHDGRILRINSEAHKVLGLAKRALPVGASLAEVLASPEYQPILQSMVQEGRRRIELDLPLPGGEVRHLEIKVSTVTDERGTFRFRVGLFNDLALKRDVEEAERKIQQLKELYQMALGIAHEIRNPLASIRGCIQEIGRLEKHHPMAPKLAEIVCRESDRLDRIIEEFLCYARKAPGPKIPLDVCRVIDEAVILLRNHPRYLSREVRWRPSGASHLVLGDRERLQQVFLNLGLNALDSTAPGAGIIEFSMKKRSFFAAQKDPVSPNPELGSGGVEIQVADNGVGIPPQNLEKIFTPFFTSKKGGTGLGLSIVHRIVQDHNGTIQVSSRPGNGTAFSIWLPDCPRARAVREPARLELAALEEMERQEEEEHHEIHV